MGGATALLQRREAEMKAVGQPICLHTNPRLWLVKLQAAPERMRL